MAAAKITKADLVGEILKASSEKRESLLALIVTEKNMMALTKGDLTGIVSKVDGSFEVGSKTTKADIFNHLIKTNVDRKGILIDAVMSIDIMSKFLKTELELIAEQAKETIDSVEVEVDLVKDEIEEEISELELEETSILLSENIEKEINLDAMESSETPITTEMSDMSEMTEG